MTVVHVTGARPNFPKAAPVIRALDAWGLEQKLVHTGQHYDDRLSEVFFRELDLPYPDVNLGVGSGSHASQTASAMVGLEEVLTSWDPSLVVVYGDVNSTIAAGLVCSKMQVPLAHVEAGLRSFDLTMPEEINRRLVDQLSALLFVTSPEAIGHLAREGVPVSSIYFVGNPMIDTLMAHLDAFSPERYRPEYGLERPYIVATLHRPANVDSDAVARQLISALHSAADRFDILIPLHPRGRDRLSSLGLERDGVKVVEPLGYIEFMSLVRGSNAVVTDSGGVQEETTMLGVPCLTLRPNTERPVTITNGTNRLVTPMELPRVLQELADLGRPPSWPTPPLWDGKAGARIAEIVARWLSSSSQ